jgi:hypothetical protein
LAYERHLFVKSNLCIEVGPLGRRLGVRDEYANLPASQESKTWGSIPEVLFEGWSQWPADAPGWVIALGHVPFGKPVAAFGAAAFTDPGTPKFAQKEPDELPEGRWVSVDCALLGGTLWAAELRREQQWLKLVVGNDEHIWFHPYRPFGDYV